MSDRTPSTIAGDREEWDEQQLLCALRSDDEPRGHAAIDTLVRLHSRAMWNVAYGVLADRDAAADVAQDVFIELWDHRHQFGPCDSMRRYLTGATRNRACNVLRNRDRAARNEARAAAESRQYTEGTALFQITWDDAMHCVALAEAEAPPGRRRIFALAFHEGLTRQEITERADVSKNTVKTQLQRMRSRIRELLVQRQVLEPWEITQFMRHVLREEAPTNV